MTNLEGLYDVERMSKETGISATRIREAINRSPSKINTADLEVKRVGTLLSLKPSKQAMIGLLKEHPNSPDVSTIIIRKLAFEYLKTPGIPQTAAPWRRHLARS